MFDAQRILGTLISGALTPNHRRRRHSSFGGLDTSTAAIGMGLLGVALSAYEHYSASNATAQVAPGAAPSTAPATGPTQVAPPPPPSFQSIPVQVTPAQSRPVVPPKPPAAPPPLPTPAAAPNTSQADQDALVLIRAMIAAAHADWSMDDDERATILEHLSKSELTDEERDFIEREIDNPVGVDELVSQARLPEMAEQIYVASLLAIAVDTDAERGYLKKLAQKLQLPETRTAQLQQEFAATQ